MPPYRKDQAREDAFLRFAHRIPKEALDDGIDWEKAEAEGFLNVSDSLEGVWIIKAPLKTSRIRHQSQSRGNAGVIFSHTKHTVWNGCELCHPDIFVGVKKGINESTMVELFDGKYCGVCHDKVAFPQSNCEHSTRKRIEGK